MTRKDAVLLGPLLGSFFELLSRYRVGHIPRRQRLNRAQKIRLVGAININNLNGYIRGDVANNDWFENSFCESIVNVEDLQAWRHKETPFESRKSRGFGWQAYTSACSACQARILQSAENRTTYYIFVGRAG